MFLPTGLTHPARLWHLVAAMLVLGLSNTSALQTTPSKPDDQAEFPTVPVREVAPGVRLFGNVPPFAEAGHINEVIALPDGRNILTVSREGLFVFDLETGKKTGTLDPPPGDFGAAWVSPNRSTLVVFSIEWVPGTVEHPEPRTTQHHLTWYDAGLVEAGHLVLEPEQFDKDDRYLPRAWAFSANGRLLALASSP
jgi:hypothetical protein